MHLITLFRIMNPHQRCLQAKSNTGMSQKQVMPKSENLCRSLEIKLIDPTQITMAVDTDFIVDLLIFLATGVLYQILVVLDLQMVYMVIFTQFIESVKFQLWVFTCFTEAHKMFISMCCVHCRWPYFVEFGSSYFGYGVFFFEFSP